MMVALQRWCRVTVWGPDGTIVASCELDGPGSPGIGAIGEVARLALLASRLGGGITLAEVSPAMGELLELAGLCVEMEGQAELGEQPTGIQQREEEIHPGDPSA
jgi:hypothetical protein